MRGREGERERRVEHSAVTWGYECGCRYCVCVDVDVGAVVAVAEGECVEAIIEPMALHISCVL